MKAFLLIFVSLLKLRLFAQVVDSTQYELGYKIGENIPVVLLMLVGLFFIYKGFKKRGEEKPKKTDFMNDGTIDK